MTRGCCYAQKVALIQRLKKRVDEEMNPDVKRGLKIAIYELKRSEVEK